MLFEDIKDNERIYLYAGGIPSVIKYAKFVGLALEVKKEKILKNHIQHDIRKRHELNDNSVDIYQSEDVFEHIEYEHLHGIINDIYRILKPQGVFRLSVPDYVCDIIENRSIKDKKGNIIFDPGGGGNMSNPGHLWFPKYKNVVNLLNNTNFKDITFYHYYDEKGNPITNKIDYEIGYIKRTPDHDDRVKKPYRPMSIVVDCIK